MPHEDMDRTSSDLPLNAGACSRSGDNTVLADNKNCPHYRTVLSGYPDQTPSETKLEVKFVEVVDSQHHFTCTFAQQPLHQSASMVLHHSTNPFCAVCVPSLQSSSAEYLCIPLWAQCFMLTRRRGLSSTQSRDYARVMTVNCFIHGTTIATITWRRVQGLAWEG